ncbi:MAG TPA: hypothetical protein DIW46_09450 [Microbacterium sp.]|uniref:phosphotransferase family protein n=1 Tax=Microbacterium sp. TaxID=51671 RepID=UPI000EF106D3|nr:hypothetical protein [Microbacterium sp.]
MTDSSQNLERMLLSGALDAAPASITLHSREPLGAGSVTGFNIAGEQSMQYYVDTSQLKVRVETGWVSEDARIWMHPADPHLPALAPIAFDHAADTILSRMGFTASGIPQIIAYRPGRRAVLRAQTAEGAVWVKVVRPSRVHTVVQAQTAVAEAGVPVPHVHGWSPEGLVIMADAAGIPASDFLWDPERLLDEVDLLRERIATVQWDRPVAGAAQRIRWYESRASRRASAILARARIAIDKASSHRAHTVVHGDLHYGQLFLDEQGDVCSVIDVDTLGIADPAEDSAAFLSHAIVSAGLTVAVNEHRVWALADAAAQRWGDDELVRALTAVHLVGHSISATDRAAHGAAEQSLAAADAVLDGVAPSAGGS